MNIKEWKSEERPREKLLTNGPKSLSNSELLAILIRSGNRNESAVELAMNILKSADNSLQNLSRLSIEKLKSIKGIGTTKAVTIVAALELSMRMDSETLEDKPTISSSKSAAQILSPLLKNLNHEECWVLFLSRSNRLILKSRMSSGGISSTIIDIKMIIKKALDNLASAIIIAHNHPSGNPYPGEQDIIQTKRLKDAAALVEISLLDHIIIAGDRYYSFSDETAPSTK